MNVIALKKSDNVQSFEENRPVVECLTQVLADSFTLYVKTLNYHWNVEGQRFIAIHELTEKQYRAMVEAIDEIAERIRALGFYTPGSMSAYREISRINEANSGDVDAQTMLRDLETDHRMIVEQLREGVQIADKNGDSTTADIFSDRREFHEEAAWMLRSIAK